MSDTKFIGEIAISEFSNGQNIFSFKNTTEVKGESSVTTVKIDTKEKTGVIASWGVANNTPQQVIAAVKKNGSATRALDLNIKSHYGNGIILHEEGQADIDGKKQPKLLNISDYPEVKAFFTKSQISRFAKELITDLEWWSIAFPEYILSNDFNKINRVKRQKAAWCRFEAMNPDTGLVENIYISQKFGITSVDPTSEFVAVIPVIDSYWLGG
ncbi:hypothetical protein [Flavobacterium sp. 3HN19-14]|uniref:hypothetical protein n=1 Tax=Flavobacterium sp. 3HN19-14 TaxID=3448133 RepID=UPI003EE30F71